VPSAPHEAAVALFRHSPELAVTLLREAGALRMPPDLPVRGDAAELGEPMPVELRADRVLIVGADEPQAGIVVEPQASIDASKRFSWPAYAASLRLRLRAHVVVLVIALDRKVARWARKPIAMGGGNVFVPTVIGPDDVPRIVSVAEATKAADRAVLSTLLHRSEPEAARIAHAAVLAADALGTDQLLTYLDIIIASLSSVRRRELERLMQKYHHEPVSDIARHHRAEGRAEGRVEGQTAALLLVLKQRGLVIPDAITERIRACSESEQLDAWIRAACNATRIEDVFGD
jgi:hypothetical protein